MYRFHSELLDAAGMRYPITNPLFALPPMINLDFASMDFSSLSDRRSQDQGQGQGQNADDRQERDFSSASPSSSCLLEDTSPSFERSGNPHGGGEVESTPNSYLLYYRAQRRREKGNHKVNTRTMSEVSTAIDNKQHDINDSHETMKAFLTMDFERTSHECNNSKFANKQLSPAILCGDTSKLFDAQLVPLSPSFDNDGCTHSKFSPFHVATSSPSPKKTKRARRMFTKKTADVDLDRSYSNKDLFQAFEQVQNSGMVSVEKPKERDHLSVLKKVCRNDKEEIIEAKVYFDQNDTHHDYQVKGSLINVHELIALFKSRDRGNYTMGLTKQEKADRRKQQNREAAYRARKRGQYLNNLAVLLHYENMALKNYIAVQSLFFFKLSFLFLKNNTQIASGNANCTGFSSHQCTDTLTQNQTIDNTDNHTETQNFHLNCSNDSSQNDFGTKCITDEMSKVEIDVPKTTLSTQEGDNTSQL
ncbi:hypothetical protein RFI_08897 [Reticulomyxa filosa]|uniref:BZIP domain-containing protein n=1 Tax=Reticulomyxa filosa TaxID=46433 RepID=X6NQP3_RETFI|nr:hypothetical protein RFI_08897 [Reticulomyxa filosa]|eukprot:ETO28238.1 hypothetical protein RFI_08897 [Reticulomyxa filosa]